MPKLNREWVVHAHSAVIPVDEGLVCVDGEIRMPLGRFPRRMSVARLSGGGLLVWSPIALDDDAMRQLAILGPVEWLVVPGIAHRLDIAAWKARFPRALVLCPPGAARAVSEAVPVDATGDPFADPQLSFETVAGMGGREAALSVRRGGGSTLIVNDIVANVRQAKGLDSKLMARLLGFGARGPQIPTVVRRRMLSDGPALAGWLRAKAADPEMIRLIPSHGDIMLGEEAGDGLRRVAKSLEE